MLGAIIGDIAGSKYEFAPINVHEKFQMFPEGCSFTDDTICTVAVADALLHGRSFKDSVHDWCRRYPNPMGGYGGSFNRWVQSDDPQPYYSYGNGAAMRVSPIAWLCDGLDNVTRMAEESAVISHDHPWGIKGARAVADAIYTARHLRDSKLEDLLRPIAFSYGYQIGPLYEYMDRFDETCQGTIPAAFSVLSESVSFEDAIRIAVCLRADADTLGAIVGSIAEAYYGIPVDISKKAYSMLPADMQEVVREFYKKV